MTDEAKKLKRISRLGKRPQVPSSTNPVQELSVLVHQHRALTKSSVAVDNMSSHRTNHTTGKLIECELPEDVMMTFKETAKAARARAAGLESAMKVQLKQIPIYTQFLEKVYGIGPVVAAYLVTEIDITRSTKPSSLRLFCGLAVENGRLSHRVKGEKSRYNSNMRVRIYQAFTAMWKNAAKNGTWKTEVDGTTAGLETRVKNGVTQYKVPSGTTPYGVTSKYLDVWINYKIRMLAADRVIDGKIEPLTNKVGSGRIVSAKGFIHSTGWHKAADLFLFDLYRVWRAMEGLPVWPTYITWATGYEHGGKPSLNEPKMMTIDEALEEVGYVGALARKEPLVLLGADADEDDEAIEEPTLPERTRTREESLRAE